MTCGEFPGRCFPADTKKHLQPGRDAHKEWSDACSHISSCATVKSGYGGSKKAPPPTARQLPLQLAKPFPTTTKHAIQNKNKKQKINIIALYYANFITTTSVKLVEISVSSMTVQDKDNIESLVHLKKKR